MKISKKIKKIIIYGISIFLLITAGFIVYGDKLNEQQGEYTSYNTTAKGTKALYLLAEKMNYQVERSIRPSRFLPDDATVVLLNPSAQRLNDSLELKYLKQWIARGNVLLVSMDQSELEGYGMYSLLAPGTDFVQEDDILTAKCGNGQIIILDSYEAYTNQGLKDVAPGIAFIDALDRAGKTRVIFNEYYHGMGKAGYTFWDVAGVTGRLIIIQLLFGVAVLLSLKAVRFGKPVEVFEITRRMENENLFALSNLYMKSRLNGLVLNMSLQELRRDISKFLGFAGVEEDYRLITAASENNILKQLNISRLFEECRTYIDTESKNNRRLKKLVKKIEEARRVMR